MRRFWIWVCAAALAVVAVHAVPFVLNFADHRDLLIGECSDEQVYLARIVDAYRGGTLGNPYLAEHQDAPKYLPESIERTIAASAHLLGVGPLTMIAASRLFFPFVIVILVGILGSSLGLDPPRAALSGVVATLVIQHTLNPRFFVSDTVVFPRYFRAVSPAAHAAIMLIAILVVKFITSTTYRRDQLGVVCGVLFGSLFLLPVYYWSFVIGGTAGLAMFSFPESRRPLLIAIAIAGLFAIPYAWRSGELALDPAVSDSLHRLRLMIPGRTPDYWPDLVAFPIAAWVCWKAYRGDGAARFLWPFLVAGALLTMENVFTNVQLQAHHWINCLLPLWALLPVLYWTRRVRTGMLVAIGVMLLVYTALTSTISYHRLDRDITKAAAPLPRIMPATIAWLRAHTAPGSVILGDQTFIPDLVLFTENKVYAATYAGQHALLDSEELMRFTVNERWTPALKWKPPYRADYFLGFGDSCKQPPAAGFLYENKFEKTCLAAIP